MAVEVTERWSDRAFGRGSGQKRSATRGFDVTGVSDESAALAASDATTSLAVPAHNEVHPLDASSRTKVSSRSVKRVGPEYYRVTCQYTDAGAAGEHPDDSDDPLDQPPLIEYVQDTREEAIDRDIDGNPLVNSARERFRENPNGYLVDFRLVVLVHKPFFDVALQKDVILSVNSEPLVIGGQTLADTQEARLMAYTPSGQFQLTAETVQIRHEWWIRKRVFAPQDVSPHDLRIMDRGMRALWDDSGTLRRARLYSVNEANDPETPVDSEILLNGDGGPLQDGYVLEGGLSAASAGVPDGATLETQTGARFLWYRVTKDVDHVTRLGLG